MRDMLCAPFMAFAPLLADSAVAGGVPLTVVSAAFAVIAFSGTGAVYITDLFGERERTPRVSRVGIAISMFLTLLAIVGVILESGAGALLSARHVTGVLALFIAGGFLVSNARWPMRGAGALVTPFCALLMAFFLLEQSRTTVLTPGIDAIVAVHVGLALVGLGSFALAAALSMIYLLQERQLRQRSFGRLFHRLPSLNALDSAIFHLVTVGFITYSVAILMGITSALRGQGMVFDFRTTLAVIAWVVFGAVIQTRITSGWRGRQAAWMTVAGCAVTFAVLGFYLVS
jgi:ABC-type uncharacterized transport system permease subunit